MNTTLAYLRGRRAWLVENLTVWGADSETDLILAVAETIASGKRIGYWRITLGDDLQKVSFGSLIDNRGNHLPQTIKKPAVIIIPKEAKSAFVRAVQGDTGFTVAKADTEATSVRVDVMIFETGY